MRDLGVPVEAGSGVAAAQEWYRGAATRGGLAQERSHKEQACTMDIHEYQAKEILARFGVPVPRGALAYSPEQAAYRAREIGGKAGSSRRRSTPAAAARPAASGSARTEDEVADAAEDTARQEAGDPPDRPARQDRLAPLRRGRRRHRAGALSGLRAGPQVRARDDRRLRPKAAWRSRRSRPRSPTAIIRVCGRARRRHAGLPGPRDRLRARPRCRLHPAGGDAPSSAATAPSRTRRHDGGDQPAGRHRTDDLRWRSTPR